MTAVYEVRTKHTKQVLKDFIIFREAIRNIHINFRLIVLGICGITLAYIGKDISKFSYVCLGFAALMFLFALVRRSWGVLKLGAADKLYQRQDELQLVFGEKEFHVNNLGTNEELHIRYGEVEYMYADDTYYYISVNNEDLYMLPKADFVMGTAESFYNFMMGKTKKEFRPVKISWKMKLDILGQGLLQVREENKKTNEEKQNRKNRKKNK